MAKTIRTVRFSQEEINRIVSFLEQNPFFDFSTLARLAIRKFIENPEIQVKGIGSQVVNKSKRTKQTGVKQ